EGMENVLKIGLHRIEQHDFRGDAFGRTCCRKSWHEKVVCRTDVLSKPCRKLAYHLAPGVLWRAFDEVVPPHFDPRLPPVPDELRAQTRGMNVDVVSHALTDEQPDHVWREAQRAVLHDPAMEGDNKGVGQYTSHQPAVIARTGLDGAYCRGFTGFEHGQLLL